MPNVPHYVRFARSLALTSTLVLPACGSSVEGMPAAGSDPTPPEVAAAAGSPGAAPVDTPVIPRERVSAETLHDEPGPRVAALQDAAAPLNPYATDAGADVVTIFKSGPFPPPELPAGMA